MPTTRVDAGYRAVPGRVERQFQAQAPDRIWVADITYVPTLTGFVYLAVVLDVFSRWVVGWSMAHHLRAELVLGALNMALGQRRVPRTRGDEPGSGWPCAKRRSRSPHARG